MNKLIKLDSLTMYWNKNESLMLKDIYKEKPQEFIALMRKLIYCK